MQKRVFQLNNMRFGAKNMHFRTSLTTRASRPGFHELASLFQAISLHDTLYVSVAPEGAESDSLECDTPDVPADASNLVMRAFSTFRERTGNKTHFRARLEKRIPHGAGLGGGSGNAATALWAANKLTNANCSDEDLAEFGAVFGSDISFFFTNGSAYCTGKGDRLMEIDRLNPQTLYIVKPAESLSTKDVFNKLSVAECVNGKDPRELLDKMKKGVMFADFVNDLEKPSFELLPRLKDIKEALCQSGFNVSAEFGGPCYWNILQNCTNILLCSISCDVQTVMMSGSGTSFFCLGHPSMPDFRDVFPAKYNVKVMPAMFVCRRFPGKWYFEQPPLSELGKVNDVDYDFSQ